MEHPGSEATALAFVEWRPEIYRDRMKKYFHILHF